LRAERRGIAGRRQRQQSLDDIAHDPLRDDVGD
jgi:hypothetical protein